MEYVDGRYLLLGHKPGNPNAKYRGMVSYSYSYEYRNRTATYCYVLRTTYVCGNYVRVLLRTATCTDCYIR